jgi:hypothetical protein
MMQQIAVADLRLSDIGQPVVVAIQGNPVEAYLSQILCFQTLGGKKYIAFKVRAGDLMETEMKDVPMQYLIQIDRPDVGHTVTYLPEEARNGE